MKKYRSKMGNRRVNKKENYVKLESDVVELRPMVMLDNDRANNHKKTTTQELNKDIEECSIKTNSCEKIKGRYLIDEIVEKSVDEGKNSFKGVVDTLLCLDVKDLGEENLLKLATACLYKVKNNHKASKKIVDSFKCLIGFREYPNRLKLCEEIRKIPQIYFGNTVVGRQI